MTRRRMNWFCPGTLAAMLALGGTGTLIGCESDAIGLATPEERAAATTVQHDEYSKLGYRVDWRGFPAMTPGDTISRLELFGDVVVVQESGSVVTVLEARSGEQRWSDPVGSTLTKFVGMIRDGKKLIVSSQSQAFIYDLETGALLTKQDLALVVDTKPVQVGSILVYGCSNGQVLGHLLLNGFKQWGSFMTGAINVDPLGVGSDGTVGMVSQGGDVLFIYGDTGLMRGRGNMYAGTEVALAASETMLFVASVDHSLYAFNRDGASEQWRKRTDEPLKFAPSFHDGRVYCDMGKEGLKCIEASTGKELWANKDVHGTVVGMRNKRLIAWDGATATSLDPAAGSIIESAKLASVSMVKTDKFVDGSMYLAAPSGVVTKLVPRN